MHVKNVMNKKAVSSKIVQNPTRFLVIAAILLLASFSASVQAASTRQDNLRKTVYGTDKPKAKPKPKTVKPTNNQKAIKPKTAAFVRPATPKKPVATVKKTSANRSRRTLLDVTFTAQQPDLEIWINERYVGRTDGTGEFNGKLAANYYRVMAKKNNQIAFPVKTILVSAAQTEFKLFNEAAIQRTPEPKPVPMPKIEEKRKSTEELAEELAEEISRRIKQILEDYADPSKTDTISIEDWKLVFQSAQLGQLQGFTAVQIEAQRWFASGQIEIAKADYTSAYTAFTKAIEFMPKSALPFYGLGNAYLANKQPTQALRAFEQAARLEPKMAMAHRGIGDAQRALKNKKEALAAYRNAIQLGYTAPETRYRLGVSLLESERVKEGLEQLEDLAKTAPTAEIYVAIGDGYKELEQMVSAVEFYRKAIESNPDLAVAHFKLGTIYFDEREYPKAKEALEKALELDPKGETFNHLDARKKSRQAASKIK